MTDLNMWKYENFHTKKHHTLKEEEITGEITIKECYGFDDLYPFLKKKGILKS